MTVEHLVDALRRHGLRVTPQRRRILRLLLEHGGHLSAQEAHARLRDEFPEMSLDTVYRTLRTLAVLGIACQSHLQTAHASRFGLGPGPRHHHHLICIACGHTVDIPECPLPEGVEEVCARHGFAAAGHAFEIYGTCAPCRNGGR